MGITYADIELINSDDLAMVRRGYLQPEQVRRLGVTAMVDSGASMLSISQTVQQKLGIEILGEGDAELADGSVVQLNVVGPIEVRFKNRRTIVEALVVPTETDVLLGAIPMEGMDILLDPKRQQLVVNPQSPDKARLLLK